MNKPVDGAWLRPDPAAAAIGPGKPAWVRRIVLRAIAEGALAVGERLPSARTMAREWGVSRGVVDDAFALLQQEGWIERRVGAGSFVARGAGAGEAESPRTERPPSAIAQRVLTRISPLMRAAGAVRVNRDPGHGPKERLLAPGLTDVDSFDLEAWRRALLRTSADGRRGDLAYGASAGQPALRDSTARWLALTRGLRVAPEQVIVVNGPSQALELMSRVLFEPGQAVVVEEPSFSGAPRILALAGLRVFSAPLDAEGFDVATARIRQPRPVGIYLNPLNQFPLGRWTTLARRQELLRWAREADAWIVESDYFNEVVFDAAPPPPTLHALDDEQRVIHIGSFNMTMFPSLRLGWMVLPPRLVPLMTEVRGLFGDHCSVPLQAALAEFIDSGALSRRVRSLQQLLAGRRERLFAAAAEQLPAGLALAPMPGGATACLPLPRELHDAALARAAAAVGVAAEALSDHCWNHPAAHGLVLGVGQTPGERIAEGVTRLAAVLRGVRTDAAC
jgi:GntR family transcriptional regulator/MocR family aminotransferase